MAATSETVGRELDAPVARVAFERELRPVHLSLSLSRALSLSLFLSLPLSLQSQDRSREVIVTTEDPMWGHPMPVLGALSPFLEPFCGHLSPKLDKVS